MKETPKAKIASIDSNGQGFITVVWDNTPFTIRSEEEFFPVALEAYKKEDWSTLYQAMNPANYINEQYKHLDIAVVNGQVTYKGSVIHNAVTVRILDFIREKLNISHLVAFLQNLMENPSMASVNELYQFLEHKNIPITDKGTFLAYKSIRQDWTDWHTGRVSNKIGESPRMARNLVDDNRRNHCSSGYHVGALEYATDFNNCSGRRIVICEVNPADVVSVPEDHNCQKVRVTGYTVVGEYDGPLTKPLYKSGVNAVNDVEDFYDYEDATGHTLVKNAQYVYFNGNEEASLFTYRNPDEGFVGEDETLPEDMASEMYPANLFNDSNGDEFVVDGYYSTGEAVYKFNGKILVDIEDEDSTLSLLEIWDLGTEIYPLDDEDLETDESYGIWVQNR